MAEERKRVEKKPFKQQPLKTRPDSPKEEPSPKNRKKKAEELVFVRLSENAGIEKFKAFRERIIKGELEKSFYGIDGNISYHYYIVINKS